MKKIKIILSSLIAISFLSSCELFTKKISTFEELISSRGAVSLKNDIDGEFYSIDALRVSSINGNGHTIKNVVVNSESIYDEASLFSSSTHTIENLVLDNISVITSSSYVAAIVSVGGTSKIDNVHVINSRVECSQIQLGSGLGKKYFDSYVGGIYGGFYNKDDESYPLKDNDCKITSCSVKDSVILVEGHQNSVTGNVYAGGISGMSGDIDNCKLINCEISANSNSLCSGFAGGITAVNENKISNCLVKKSKINASATKYKEGSLDYYTTARTFLGGIAAVNEKEGNISYCYANDNKIQGNSSGLAYIGGIVGEDYGFISQLCASENEITAFCYASGNANDVCRFIGGIT